MCRLRGTGEEIAGHTTFDVRPLAIRGVGLLVLDELVSEPLKLKALKAGLESGGFVVQ